MDFFAIFATIGFTLAAAIGILVVLFASTRRK